MHLLTRQGCGKDCDYYLSDTDHSKSSAISTKVDKHYRMYLTQKQFDVLKLVATGKSNKEIAQYLYVEKRTIEHHVRSLLKQTGFTNRTMLAIFYNNNKDKYLCKKATNKY